MLESKPNNDFSLRRYRSADNHVPKPQMSENSCRLPRVLGGYWQTDIIATINVPPADNSAMDGYAFCYADALKSDFKLPSSQRIPAGVAPKALNPSTVARIFTGAEIPAGADTVAMQENCTEQDGTVTIGNAVTDGPIFVAKVRIFSRARLFSAPVQNSALRKWVCYRRLVLKPSRFINP